MKARYQTFHVFGLVICGFGVLPVTVGSLTTASAGGADRKIDIAVVDLKRMNQEFEGFKADNQRFNKYREDKVKILQVREFMTPAEWDELDMLEGRKNPKPEEEKRMVDLRSISDRRRQLKRELEAKVDLTDKDREELDRIRKLPRSNQVRLEDLSNRFQTEIEQEGIRLQEKLLLQVTGVYDKLARSRGFSVVFDKSLVQWSGNDMDITDEVLKQLNGKK